MSKTVSICMAYFERRQLFENTLRSILTKEILPDQIIIVDDGSVKEPLDPKRYPAIVKVVSVPNEVKTWTNPCVPYNIAFSHATSDIVIIQNPECYHIDNVVEHARNIQANEYIAYGCYSLPQNTIPETHPRIGRTFSGEGEDCWYNHSIHRPSFYHFCAAINRIDLEKVGGFDLRFADGIAFDDDAFVLSLRRNNLNLINFDNYVVGHQYHYQNRNKPPDFWERLQRNRTLFENMKNE